MKIYEIMRKSTKVASPRPTFAEYAARKKGLHRGLGSKPEAPTHGSPRGGRRDISRRFDLMKAPYFSHIYYRSLLRSIQ